MHRQWDACAPSVALPLRFRGGFRAPAVWQAFFFPISPRVLQCAALTQVPGDAMVMPASETLCQLAPRQPLPAPQGRHLWRVRRGVLRMDSLAPGPDAGRFVRMALPGDVLGVEHWAGMQESCQVFALTSAELVPLVPTAAQAIDLLVDTVVLAHQRASEALTLRSGPVAKRVQRLLLLLAHSEGRA